MSDVKAIAVAYFLNVDEEWKEKVGDLWEKGFLIDLKEKAEIYAPDLQVRIKRTSAGEAFLLPFPKEQNIAIPRPTKNVICKKFRNFGRLKVLL